MAYSAFHTLKIDHFKVNTTQTDFPVYIDITHSTLRTVANGGSVTNSSGFDIGFSSDSAGTLLYKWEREAYDPVNGRIRAHVKVPSVSGVVPNTVFYMPYADASIVTDLSDPVNVWTNSFLAVYHLKDGTTLSVLDARNVNNGINNGATASAGQVDGAGSFVSVSSQYVDLGTAMNPAAATYSVWVKATSFPNASNGVLVRNTTHYISLQVNSTGKLAMYVFANAGVSYDGTGVNTLVSGTWYHLALTYDSTNGLKGYVNGVIDGTATANGALNTTSHPTHIGQDPANAGRFWNGLIDEARISSVARSVDWLFAEYNNQNSPSTFIYFDAEPPLSRAIIDAGTGYSTVADWTDTTPQPGSAASGTDRTELVTPFLWPTFPILAQGRLLDAGGSGGGTSKESWGVFGE